MGTQPAVRPSGDTITDGSDYAVKVLVIDDEPLLRDVLAEFLELLGHEADLAADARDGLARFDPSVHQIVLTDFLMPGLMCTDGIATTAHERRSVFLRLLARRARRVDEQDVAILEWTA